MPGNHKGDLAPLSFPRNPAMTCHPVLAKVLRQVHVGGHCRSEQQAVLTVPQAPSRLKHLTSTKPSDASGCQVPAASHCPAGRKEWFPLNLLRDMCLARPQGICTGRRRNGLLTAEGTQRNVFCLGTHVFWGTPPLFGFLCEFTGDAFLAEGRSLGELKRDPSGPAGYT